MELWLDCRESKQLIDDYNFDKFLSNETIAGKETIICNNNSILINQEIVGSIISGSFLLPMFT